MPSDEGEDDPELIEELKRIELREKAHRRAQFDDILVRTRKNWDAFSKEPYLTGFRTIRDKVAAHTEVLLVADKYQFVDIGTLGIKWLDMKTAIGSMQGLVKDLGILVRNASFEWDMFDEQLTKTSVAFWSDAT